MTRYKTRTIIELNSRHAKLIQAQAGKVTHCRFMDIGGFDDGKIIKQLQALRRDMALGLANSQVIAVISRQHVIVRYLDLPSTDPEELRRMVQLQAMSQVPYSPDDIVFDFTIMTTTAEGRSRIMVVFIPKDIIVRYWNIFMGAQIPPAIMTVSSIGIMEWYKMSRTKNDGVTVIVDTDALQSEVCLCDQKYLLTSRYVPLGLANFEAQGPQWLKHIDLTVDGYNQDKLGPLPSRLLIISVLDVGQKFQQFLSQEYKLPVYLMPSVEHFVHTQKSLKWPKEIVEGKTSATAALGLAFGNLENSINLIPTQLHAQYQKRQGRSAFFRAARAILFTAILAGVATWANFSKKHLQLDRLKQQWQVTKKDLDSIDKKKAQLEALTTALNQRVIMIEVINEIYRSAPKGISLVNMTLNSRRNLSLQGVTYKAGDINQFQESLVKSPLFASVSLDYVNKRSTQEREIQYFKLTCQIK